MMSKICEIAVPVEWAEATGSGYWHCTHSGCEAWPAAQYTLRFELERYFNVLGSTRLASQQYVANKPYCARPGQNGQGGEIKEGTPISAAATDRDTASPVLSFAIGLLVPALSTGVWAP